MSRVYFANNRRELETLRGDRAEIDSDWIVGMLRHLGLLALFCVASGFSPVPRVACRLAPGRRACHTVLMQDEPPPLDELPPPLPPPPPPPRPSEPDLFIPIMVGVAFGGYALIILYDVLTNGICAPQFGLYCDSGVASGGW